MMEADVSNSSFLDGMNDPRVIFTSTGSVATGCHNARNAGFPLATGRLCNPA